MRHKRFSVMAVSLLIVVGLTVASGCGTVSRSRGTVVINASGVGSKIPGDLPYKMVFRSGSTLVEFSGKVSALGDVSRQVSLPAGSWVADIEILNPSTAGSVLYEGTANLTSKPGASSPVTVGLQVVGPISVSVVVGTGNGRITVDFAPPPVELTGSYGTALLSVIDTGRTIYEAQKELVPGSTPVRFDLVGFAPGKYTLAPRFLRPNHTNYFLPRAEDVVITGSDNIRRSYTAPGFNPDQRGAAPPAVPGLKATYSTETGLVTLSWTKVSCPEDDIVGYYVTAFPEGKRSEFLGPWSPESSSGVVVPDYRGNWSFRIGAMDAQGNRGPTFEAVPLSVE